MDIHSHYNRSENPGEIRKGKRGGKKGRKLEGTASREIGAAWVSSYSG